MTIRFLTAWNGYHEQQVVSGLGATEEARLIGLGFAASDLDGPSNNAAPTATGVARALRIPGPGRPLSIIPLGDSITIGGGSVTSGLWRYGSSYANHLIMTSGRYRVLRNAGVSGNTTAQMLARVDADVIAYAPDACLILGGTNDLTSGMTDAAMASVMDNVEAIVLRLLNAGILPIIATPPPKDAAASEARKIQRFFYLLAEHYGLPLIDLYRVFVDAATGNFKSGYSSDGIHPNNTAISALSTAYAAPFAAPESLVAPVYLAAFSEAASGNPANLIRNGSFANGTPIPTGWNGNSTYTSLVAASYPYSGNTVTSAAHPLGNVLVMAANITTGFSAGDVLRFSGRCKTSGLTLASANGVTLGLNVGGTTMAPLSGWGYNNTHAFSTEFTIPSGVTTISGSLYAGDANGTYELNNLTLWNLTATKAVWRPGTRA